MDPELLASQAFWADPAFFIAGEMRGAIADASGLRGQVLFQTSGSSGEPKWIALAKPALLESAAAVNEHLEVESSSCWGLALPIHHVGGFGVAARVFASGCRMEVFDQRWDAQTFHAWITAKRVTHTSLVPTQVHDLVAAGFRAPAGLTAVVVGGGQLAQATGQTARDMGWPVLASYGMTETCSQIATQKLDQMASSYQPAPLPLLPIWQARLSMNQCLEIAGPALFSGMLEQTEGAWIFRPRETEWHLTADRVSLDGRLLTPLGRADLLVKVLGELVDPQAIERELATLSGGRLADADLVVLAVPDARAEHRLVPVFDSAVEPGIAADVLHTYQQQAPGFRRLDGPVFLQGFPRSSLGKPRRAEIFARLI